MLFENALIRICWNPEPYQHLSRPLLAPVAGLAECAGGTALALGLLMPISAAAIITAVLAAIVPVHWPHGLWATQGSTLGWRQRAR